MTDPNLNKAARERLKAELQAGTSFDRRINCWLLWDADFDWITDLALSYTAEAVRAALINLKDINYPPSGKEYYFKGVGGWTNDINAAVEVSLQAPRADDE